MTAEKSLRLLLIAYEFPPSPSPQSLRWGLLVRELVSLGVDVHVLTVETDDSGGAAAPPLGITVYRTPPGGVAGLVVRVRRLLRGRDRAPAGAPPVADSGDGAVGRSAGARVNWKGRVYHALNQALSLVTFPDERGRWEHHGRQRLEELLETLRPDVVVSSHEPATTLRLGAQAKAAGFHWVADLGDPVLSFYTPARWRRESMRVERMTCRVADHVIVTTEAARQLLVGRHTVPWSRLSVLTQGYDPVAIPTQAPGVVFDAGRLELLYTGRFYRFREPRVLVDAVLACPGARLSIATARAPDWLLPLLEEHPAQLRLLGFVPHAQAVWLQRSADVLVNIANDDPVHVPGKIYEYLGAGRPILHLGDNDDDVAANLVRSHRRGLAIGKTTGAVAHALAELAAIKRDDVWSERFSLDQTGVEQYQWQAIARRLHAILGDVVAPGP